MEIWRCKQGSLPDTYLGLPLGAKFKCVAVWDRLVDRIRKRLGLWKRRYLSKGGRLVLIKSTLLCLPVYMFSCRLAPVSIIDAIEKIVRLFLWGTSDGKRKMHLVAFEGVCLPIELGGLGLKRVREINLSLLCKWFWRIREDHLWSLIVKEKYGLRAGGVFPKKSNLPMGISVWRGLAKVEELFQILTKVELGDGVSTSFWLDKWCSSVPLARMFPKLFESTSTKGSSVADLFLAQADGVPSGFFGINARTLAEEPTQVQAL